GGAIGAEVAQAYGRIGCRVELIEAGPRLVAAEEPEASDVLRPHLEADGVKVHLGMRCRGVEHSEAGFKLQLEGAQPVTAEKLLVATGRKARLCSVDLAAAGLATTERGWLKVNPSTLEAAGGIFAGGDVTGIGGFTHLAFYHGQVITMRLLGGDNRADHTAVPRVTFTDPEVASVGISEKGAFERNIDAVTVVTDPGETARGYIHDFKGGVVKLVADRQARVLVGATIVQPPAGLDPPRRQCPRRRRPGDLLPDPAALRRAPRWHAPSRRSDRRFRAGRQRARPGAGWLAGRSLRSPADRGGEHRRLRGFLPDLPDPDTGSGAALRQVPPRRRGGLLHARRARSAGRLHAR